MGALDKCSSYIKSVRASSDHRVLVFDLGDFLPAIADSERSEYIVKMMAMVGYDAIVPGDQEFLIGQSQFEGLFPTAGAGEPELPPKNGIELTPESKFREQAEECLLGNIFLGNLQYSNQRAVFPQEFNFSLPEVSAVIRPITVIAPSSFLFFPADQGGWFEVIPWDQYLPGKFPPDSFNLLLSHSGLMTDIEIARLYPEIDLIIGGHSQNALFEPVIEGRSIIVQAGGFGRYVGRLDLRLEDNNIADYQYQLAPMQPEIASDTAIQSLIGRYEEAFFRDKKPRPHITVYPDSLKIYSAETCRQCHLSEYDSWSGSVHGQAFTILQQRGKTFNPGCLSCHTTGYGHRQGFTIYKQRPQCAGVGCVECHYTPAGHLKEGAIKPQPITESTCVRCHTSRNSPAFDFPAYRCRAAHR